jgi:hypothetical protein
MRLSGGGPAIRRRRWVIRGLGFRVWALYFGRRPCKKDQKVRVGVSNFEPCFTVLFAKQHSDVAWAETIVGVADRKM